MSALTAETKRMYVNFAQLLREGSPEDVIWVAQQLEALAGVKYTPPKLGFMSYLKQIGT